MLPLLPASRPLRHLLFWLGVLAYFGVPQLLYPDYRHTVASYFFGFDYRQSPYFLLILVAYTLGVAMLYAYAFLHGVLPRLLAGQLGAGLGWFALLTLAICYLFRLLSALHLAVVDPWLRHRPAHALDPRHFQGLFVNQVYIHEYGTIILAIATYKLLESWQRRQRATGQLLREQARTELLAAQARLHPPLLLGSLLALQALLDSPASAQAPALVLTLSQFLRYVLYDTQAESAVPLGPDLEALHQYFTLKQAQLREQVAVAFHAGEASASQVVAPLQWLPLLEHAFQHAATTTEGAAWLNAQLTVTPQQWKLSVSYGTDEEPTAAGRAARATLYALQRQLAAHYPGQPVLRLTPEPGLLLAVLTFDLPAPTSAIPFTSPLNEVALPARGR